MIEIQLSPDVEARITAEAQAQGVPVRRYLEGLLEEAVRARPALLADSKTLTKAELNAFFAAMSANSEKIPQLPDKAFQRESFYQDHDGSDVC